MTEEMARKLVAGDQVMVSTSDGCGGADWGSILVVHTVSDQGVHVGNNVVITDVRRIDLYRKAKTAVAKP